MARKLEITDPGNWLISDQHRAALSDYIAQHPETSAWEVIEDLFPWDKIGD